MPGRPKGTTGTPKTGGRKKGTPNKKTAEIRRRIEGYDPIGKLMALADETKDEELKVRVLLGVVPFSYSRLAMSQIDPRASMMPDLKLEIVAAPEDGK